jgi:hypothetical protein
MKKERNKEENKESIHSIKEDTKESRGQGKTRSQYVFPIFST